MQQFDSGDNWCSDACLKGVVRSLMTFTRVEKSQCPPKKR